MVDLIYATHVLSANATHLLSMADDMAAAACAMSISPQNYTIFIETRDKLKQALQNQVPKEKEFEAP